ncbi:hypothetical protein [uncultured phage MedDCM-OCT-S04-C714]|nr:hypothetical protein [uncultured phage MedDCM-OCT-S04-C714]
MPGRLVFSTTADGASSPTERMRIDSAGKVAIGTSSSQGKLTVQQSAVSNAPSRNAVLYLEDNGNCEIQMVANSNNNVQLRMGTSGNSFDGALDYDVADHKLDVYTNTTKQVTITSTGNVGIGTQTTTAKLTVSDNSGTGYKNLLDMHASSAGQNPLMRLISRNAANTSTTSVDIFKAYQSGFTINNTDTAASNFTSFNVGASEGMRIDSSGRLLVGTSSNYGLTTNAVFAGNSSKGVVSIINDGDTFLNTNDLLGAVEFGGHESGGTAYIGASIQAECDSVWTGDSPGRLVFATTANSASSPTPRMRINSSGSLKITANTNVDNIYSYAAATGTSAVCFRGGHSATAGNPGVGTDSIYIFANGNIQNTNDSYGQISDIKLKENIVDASSQWDDFKAVRFRKYNFKAETGHETHTQLGVIAQELELTSPGLVYETIDRDEEGNDLGTTTKAVKSSILTKKALVALQEAMERIETLEQRLSDAGIA